MLEKVAMEQALQAPLALLLPFFLAIGYQPPGIHEQTIKNDKREVVAEYVLFVPEVKEKEVKPKVLTFFTQDKVSEKIYKITQELQIALVSSKDEKESVEILKDITKITSVNSEKLKVIVDQTESDKILSIICQSQTLIDEVYFLNTPQPPNNCKPQRGLKLTFITQQEVPSSWDIIEGLNITLIQEEINSPLKTSTEFKKIYKYLENN